MVRISDFIKPCGCRSVGECMHNMTAEFSALDAMVDEFAKEMKRKLHRKVFEGKAGWDDLEFRESIREDLIKHASKNGQEVDTANLAAMLWNMNN